MSDSDETAMNPEEDLSAIAYFGSEEETRRLWSLLQRHIRLLVQARDSLAKEPGEVWSVVYRLLWAVVDSAESFAILCPKPQLRDCYVVARTVLETITNACFICAGGETVAKRADRHARQKAYRDLERDFEVGRRKITLRWTGKPDRPLADPDLMTALTEFTNRKGGERKEWTPESIGRRLEIVQGKYGPAATVGLHFALFDVYRHASEVAHGTLFGALFSLGLTEPKGRPRGEAEIQEHFWSHMCSLLLMLNAAFNSLILVLAQEAPHLNELASRSNELRRLLRVKTKNGPTRQARSRYRVEYGSA